MRKIFIVTERRADYSRFKLILKKIDEDPELEYNLVVTGMHLLKKYGHTIEEIEKDGYNIFSTFNIFKEGHEYEDTGAEMARSLGRAIEKITYEIEKSKPDIILSGFDIAANFAATVAGAHMNIPVMHIEGGEVSGTIDESLRHGMSKFAHYHIVGNQDAKERLIKMGEVPEHVFITGNPAIDVILNVKDIPKEELRKEFGIDLDKPYFLMIQHPVTTEIEETEKQIVTTIEAIEEFDIPTIMIFPNNDAGTTKITKVIEGSEIKHFPHLSIEKFINLLKHSSALIGNSSAGIKETASFQVPTINIGTREQGRQRPENVIDVPHNKEEIKKAIYKALNDQEFKDKVSKVNNPYGDGKAAERIIKLLKEVDISQNVIQKRITY
tara:strand:- start:317 stop:1462 length:1146 start_codon:yes stop_codon:yes gene_type:complete